MAMQKDGGLVARAVREALGTLVSPEVYGQLVARALRAARLEAIPERGVAVTSFIDGPLKREIELAVGDDAAELVGAQLSPIAAQAASLPNTSSANLPSASSTKLPRTASSVNLPSTGGASAPRSGSSVNLPGASGTSPPRHASSANLPSASSPSARGASAARPSFGSDKPTGLVGTPEPAAPRREELARTARLKLSPEQLAELRRAPPDDEPGHTTRPQASDEPVEGAQRRVLAATADKGALDALRQATAKRAHVVPVVDLVGLLDALDAPDLYEPIVLIDCRKPTVHVTSVVAIGEDLPRGTTCVLWGAGEETWRDLERGPQPCRWVRCSHEATTADVGSLCAMLLG